MSEYISREELIDRLHKTELSADQIRMLVYPKEAVIGAIIDCTSADVRENIHARWITIVDSYYKDGTIEENHWECSKCGSGKSGWGEFKFCPECGAVMDGEPKGEKGY